MTHPEITALLREVSRGAVGGRTAIRLMILNGTDRIEAGRLVFEALGGSDRIESDRFGRLYYAGSGKLVREIEQAISDSDEAPL